MRFVKVGDIFSFFFYVFAVPFSWIIRKKYGPFWLVCERKNEARDNGYCFFKYIKNNHPEVKAYYAITKKSQDYTKVADIDKKSIINFGSFKHWVYYLAADINISSQKEGKPNAAVCHFLEIYGLRKNRRVYLKHGIVKDDLKWHYFDVMKVWLYICASKREYNYVLERFGYPESTLALTGLARYDYLQTFSYNKKSILIMPTAREWLSRPIKEYTKYDDIMHFKNTEFYTNWYSFLTNPTFQKLVSDNGISVVFFLHPNMQKYKEYFGTINNIKVATNADFDIQDLIKEFGCLITDFSSVFFDFAYMKKPLVYFQFDYEKYREGHYQEGYFSYEKDGFGPVCYDSQSVVDSITKIIENNFKIDADYLQRIVNFYEFFDDKNCERIFNSIVNKRLLERKAKKRKYE